MRWMQCNRLKLANIVSYEKFPFTKFQPVKLSIIQTKLEMQLCGYNSCRNLLWFTFFVFITYVCLFLGPKQSSVFYYVLQNCMRSTKRYIIDMHTHTHTKCQNHDKRYAIAMRTRFAMDEKKEVFSPHIQWTHLIFFYSSPSFLYFQSENA